MASLGGILLLFMFESYVYSEEYRNTTLALKLNNPLFKDAVCEYETFCESIPHYPTDLVAIALANNPLLAFQAYNEEVLQRGWFRLKNGDDLEIQKKTNNADSIPQTEGPEEEALCLSTEVLVHPRYGITKNNDWKFIMNQDNYTQSIRIETCAEQDKPCRLIEGFAAGYVSKCKQKYIYRQLMSIDQDGTISRESFRFPVNCCCHVEFQGDQFLERNF